MTYPLCFALRSVEILSYCCCYLFSSPVVIHSYSNYHAVDSNFGILECLQWETSCWLLFCSSYITRSLVLTNVERASWSLGMLMTEVFKIALRTLKIDSLLTGLTTILNFVWHNDVQSGEHSWHDWRGCPCEPEFSKMLVSWLFPLPCGISYKLETSFPCF